MRDIYKNGNYLSMNQTWHTEDSAWKAAKISACISETKLEFSSVAEIGCGAGEILRNLALDPHFQHASFTGFDISPQAIEMCKPDTGRNIRFECIDLLTKPIDVVYDVLLAIDVFEHIPDYIGFLEKCRTRATYKIYHIPLDMHVSAVVRNIHAKSRYSIGHLHYFSASTAIATLKDTGHEILSTQYTNGAFGLFRQHPSLSRALANIPRWLISRVSDEFAARLLGGYSLLVLTK